MPETPLAPGPDGSLARRLGIPLDGAPPGRYEVIVVVTDVAAGRSAEAREPFVVEGPRPVGRYRQLGQRLRHLGLLRVEAQRLAERGRGPRAVAEGRAA